MLTPGETVDRRYRIKREIASNARAVLFEVEQVYTGRFLALRMLQGSARDNEELRAMLLLEARLLGEIRHRCVVELTDAGEATPLDPYLVTEMLDGRTLDGLFAARGQLPVDQALDIVLAISDAMGAIHAADRVHGTLTPASVFVPTPVDDWRRARLSGKLPAAKLLDFGLAPSPLALMEGSLGAMAYAAPDRLRGDRVDARADVYALGTMLFEALTGELPRVTDVSAPTPRDTREEVSAKVGDVVRRSLGPPAKRYANADELAAALREARKSQSSKASDVPAKQRRRFARAAYVAPVRVVTSDQEPLDGRTEDISEGGLLVLCGRTLGERERVQVRFALPTSGKLVTVAAEARWIRSARGGKGAVGLEFQKPPEDVVDDIRRFVAHFDG